MLCMRPAFLFQLHLSSRVCSVVKHLHTKKELCFECRTDFQSTEAKEWLDTGFHLISRGSVTFLQAASACFSFAFCRDENIVNPLQIARKLHRAGFYGSSLGILIAIVEPVLVPTPGKRIPVTVEIVKAFLLLFSVIRAWTERNDCHSDEDRFRCLCAAKESLLLALQFRSEKDMALEIPDEGKIKRDIDAAIAAADVHEKRCRNHATRVTHKCGRLNAAWASREWEELWRLISEPPDEDENLNSSFYTNRKDSTLEALDGFLAQRVGFLDKMRGDDQAGLKFFSGVAKINEDNFQGGLLDIERAAWSGQHSDWLPTAAVKVLIALFSIPEAASVIGHKSLYHYCAGLRAEYLISLTSDFKLKSCGLFPELSELFPPAGGRFWPDFSVRSAKTARKYEDGIMKNILSGKWSDRDAAMAYLDFLPACCHSSEVVVSLLMAASWFLKELDSKVKNAAFLPTPGNGRPRIHPEVYAVKQMVFECTRTACQIFRRRLHPGMQFYVLRQSLAMAIYAVQLANQDFTDNDSEAIVEMFHSLIYVARLCPFWQMPVVGLSEAILLSIVSGQLHSEFMLELQKVTSADDLLIKMQEIDYQIYENDLLQLSELVDGDNAYAKSAETLLNKQGWTWENVADVMTSPLLPRTPEGWLIQQPKFAADLEYAELVGFEIDMASTSSSLRLIVKRPDGKSVGLFSQSDVAESIRLNKDNPSAPFFSLDSPSIYERYHPFQQLRFHPSNIQGSGLLQAMLEADYLMKSFSVGADVSAKPPFKQRPTLTRDGDGLLDKLPSNMRSILRPVHDRKSSGGDSCAHRFWIQADELTYERKAENAKVTYYFKKPTMVVRTSPMIHDVDGKLIDFPEMDPDSPELQFANDLTTHYDEIGTHFPIFLRLRELVKLSFLGRVVHGILDGMKEREANVTIDEKIVTKAYNENWTKVCNSIEDAVRKMRDEIDSKGGINAFVEGTLSSLVSQLTELCDRWVSQRELEGHVKRWLRSERGSARRLAEVICTAKNLPTRDEIRNQSINYLRGEYRKERVSFENVFDGIIRNGLSSGFRWSNLPKVNPCQWVPAALYKSESEDRLFLCYGGVILAPNCRQGRVPLSGIRSTLVSIYGTGKTLVTSCYRPGNQAGKFGAKNVPSVPTNSQEKNGAVSSTTLVNNNSRTRLQTQVPSSTRVNLPKASIVEVIFRRKAAEFRKGNIRRDNFDTAIEKGCPYTGQNKNQLKKANSESLHVDHVVELQQTAHAYQRSETSKAFQNLLKEGRQELKTLIIDVVNGRHNLVVTPTVVNQKKRVLIGRCLTDVIDRRGAEFLMGEVGVKLNNVQRAWKEAYNDIVTELREKAPKYMREAVEIFLANLQLSGTIKK
eukprot:m.204528 g.204528  ORF g.204528 m.204528 type:complete len:1359 (+) comp39650_c0_seq3:191-4267(+)